MNKGKRHSLCGLCHILRKHFPLEYVSHASPFLFGLLYGAGQRLWKSEKNKVIYHRLFIQFTFLLMLVFVGGGPGVSFKLL